jgi:hypothetical protein
MISLPPKHRWLRYSIRTLLVAVTILCVWLGWQVSIVHERMSVRKQLEGRAYLVETTLDSLGSSSGQAGTPAPRLSSIREAVGDRWVNGICYWQLEPAELERVKKAFPEARIESVPASPVSIVLERRKLLQLVLNNGGSYMRGQGVQWSWYKARERGWIDIPRDTSQPFPYSGHPLPWPREALGDRTITVIGVPDNLADDETIQRLRENFSESILCLIPRHGQSQSAESAPPPQQSQK